MPASDRVSTSTGDFAFSRYLHAHPGTYRLAVALFVLCAAVGLSVGLTRVFDDATVQRQDAKDALEAYAAAWRLRINTRFSEAISIATSAAIFVAGAATTVPNHNGTRAERVQLVDAARWEAQGYWLFRHVPGLLAVELQPSGIIAQNYPVDNSTLGFDVMSHPAFGEAYRAIVVSGENAVQGPYELVQGGWGLLARAPVYLGPTSRGWDTFWGTATLAFRIGDVLEGMNFSAMAARDGYDFTVVRRHSLNTTVDVIATSRPHAADSVALEGTSFTVRLDDVLNNLDVSIARAVPLPLGKPSVLLVTGVVAAVAALTLLVVALIVAAAWVAFTVRHAAMPHRSSREPRDTIMALVSVKSMTWWKEHGDPERLQSDLTTFEQATARIARAHGCHFSGSLSDGCVLVVAADAAKIRRFASAACSDIVVTSHASVTEPAAGGGGQDTPRSSRSRRSRRSSSQVSNISQSSTLPGQYVPSDFTIAVAMHIGQLRVCYDPAEDHAAFQGPGIAVAARAADAARGGEVLATEDFVAEYASVCGPAQRTEIVDGEIELLVLERAEASAFPPGVDLGGASDTAWKQPMDDADRDRYRQQSENDSSVATSLSATTGTVLRKVVAVLHLEILPAKKVARRRRNDNDDDAHPHCKAYPRVLRAVAAAAHLHKGEVTATTGATVTVLFNARVPASDPWSRAVHADDRVRVAMQRMGLRVVSAVSTGRCLVATVDGAHVMCVGDAVTRALRLHSHLMDVVLTNERPAAPRRIDGDAAEEEAALESADGVSSSHSSREAGVAVPELPMLRTCVVDGISVDVLRRRFEIQCIGAFSVAAQTAPLTTSAAGASAATLLAYAVEREWEGADHQHDEWLYRMQQLEEQSVFAGVNGALEALHANPADEDAHRAARAVITERLNRVPAAFMADPPTAGPVPTPGPTAPYSVQQLAAALRDAMRKPSTPS